MVTRDRHARTWRKPAAFFATARRSWPTGRVLVAYVWPRSDGPSGKRWPSKPILRTSFKYIARRSIADSGVPGEELAVGRALVGAGADGASWPLLTLRPVAEMPRARQPKFLHFQHGELVNPLRPAKPDNRNLASLNSRADISRAHPQSRCHFDNRQKFLLFVHVPRVHSVQRGATHRVMMPRKEHRRGF
jgi:hypothetical protein